MLLAKGSPSQLADDFKGQYTDNAPGKRAGEVPPCQADPDKFRASRRAPRMAVLVDFGLEGLCPKG